MSITRDYSTASTLTNGLVLVAGGYNGASYLNSAELYNPSTGAWTSTATMSTFRGYHTASTLTDGKVLLTGGSDGGTLNSAELYQSI
ncbi:unnamed protein product [Adineta steineri]|nr:unnamed protein product [Adineta steineri]